METLCDSRWDIGGVPCRLGAKLLLLHTRNQLFSCATRCHLCHLLPRLAGMVPVRVLRLYFAAELKNKRFMETNNWRIEATGICRIKSPPNPLNGYPDIRCGKEAVSYRFNDLLSYCRIASDIYRSGQTDNRITAASFIQCPAPLTKQINKYLPEQIITNIKH